MVYLCRSRVLVWFEFLIHGFGVFDLFWCLFFLFSSYLTFDFVSMVLVCVGVLFCFSFLSLSPHDSFSFHWCSWSRVLYDGTAVPSCISMTGRRSRRRSLRHAVNYGSRDHTLKKQKKVGGLSTHK